MPLVSTHLHRPEFDDYLDNFLPENYWRSGFSVSRKYKVTRKVFFYRFMYNELQHNVVIIRSSSQSESIIVYIYVVDDELSSAIYRAAEKFEAAYEEYLQECKKLGMDGGDSKRVIIALPDERKQKRLQHVENDTDEDGEDIVHQQRGIKQRGIEAK